jgi:hypothetical protein
MNELSHDEISIIILFLKDNDPCNLYKLRLISKDFKIVIDNLKNTYVNYDITSIQNKINFLSHGGTFQNFKWLFNNGIYLNKNNLNNLIHNKRIDIFNECFNYNHIVDIIFEKSVVSDLSEGNTIFDLVNKNNILYNLTKYNHIIFIQKILEFNIQINPYHSHINGCFDISIKYNYKDIINYILINFSDKIFINNKINKIIKEVVDCEDILNYILENFIIKTDKDIIINLIKRNYNNIILKLLKNKDYLNYSDDYILECFKKNNTLIFNTLINKKSKLDFVKDENNIKTPIQKKFLINIILHHLTLFNNTKLLELCLENKLDISYIIILLENNHKPQKKDFELALLYDNDNDWNNLIKLLSKYI